MKIAVLGSGTYGTALGSIVADKGNDVWIYTRRETIEKSINEDNENSHYLPDLKLPPSLKASRDMEQCLSGAELVVLAIPTQQLGSVVSENVKLLPEGVPLVSAAKGVEKGSLRLVSEILEESLPESYHKHLAYLSGPSFAKEMVKKMPTVVSIAAHNENTAKHAQETFASSYFRTYRTADVTGVEVGGALKNVVAIAAGVADGLGMGYNTRAALITRGLTEITRLGVAKGAEPITFLGLAGMGDLVLTCTAELSRNRTVGFNLGQGKKLNQILEEMNQVAEGVVTTESAYQLSQKLGVEMAITNEVYKMLYEDKEPEQVGRDLMGRELKTEAI